MPNFRYVPDIKATGEMLRDKVDDPILFQVIQQLLDRDQQLEDIISTLDITARVIAWAAPLTANIPRGWLYCNGQAVSRTAYANLYHVIGDTYGAGDGSTTFNVPNLTLGRTIVGYEASLTNFDAIGETGGSIASNMPSHSHGGATLADGAFNVGHDNNHGNIPGETGHSHSHFHTGHIGNIGFNFAAHSHHDRPGFASEAPFEDFRAPGAAVPVNIDSNANGSSGHIHGGPPSHSNHSVGSHTHLISAEGGVGNNLPPYITMRFLIRI